MLKLQLQGKASVLCGIIRVWIQWNKVCSLDPIEMSAKCYETAQPCKLSNQRL